MSFLSFISWKDEGGFEASWQPVLRTLPPWRPFTPWLEAVALFWLMRQRRVYGVAFGVIVSSEP